MTNAQKKQAIGILVTLIVLVAALFGLKYYNKYANEKKEQEEEAAKIYVTSAEVGDITAFSWQLEDETVTMVKEDDTWSCGEHPGYEIDTDKVEDLLENIAPLEAVQTVEDPEEDAAYGFDDPENVITYTAGGEEVTLIIGMENAITGGCYLKSSEDGTVYLIDSSLLNTFDCDASTLEKEEGESETSEASDISELSQASETSEE